MPTPTLVPPALAEAHAHLAAALALLKPPLLAALAARTAALASGAQPAFAEADAVAARLAFVVAALELAEDAAADLDDDTTTGSSNRRNGD